MLNNGRKSTRTLRRFLMRRFLKTMTLGIFRGMTLPTHIETRVLVALAILWALFRQLTLG